MATHLVILAVEVEGDTPLESARRFQRALDEYQVLTACTT